MTRGPAIATWSVACALTYLGLSRLALLWRGDLSPTPLWIATAGATAVVIAAPSRVTAAAAVVGSLVGGVLSGWWVFDDTFRQMLAPVAANTIEIVVVAVLVTRWLPPGPAIRRTRDAVRLVGIILVATALSATVAVLDTASVVIEDRWTSWGRWVLGDSVGQLLVLPVLLTRRARLITTAMPHTSAELLASTMTLAAVTAAACTVDWPLIYLTGPLVLWLAIRFGPRVTAPIALTIAVVVTVVTGRGGGPFAAMDDAVAQAQLLSVVIGLSSLIGGAHALRAWDDHQRLVAVLASLPDVVLVRSTSGAVLDAWVPTQHDDDIAAVVPGIAGGAPIVDGPIPAAGDPSLVVAPSGTTFERRRAELDSGRVIELYRDVTDEHRLNKLMRERDEALEDARVREQVRIANEIHDSPLQLVIAARMRLEALASDEDPPGRPDRLASVGDLLKQATSELRGQITALTPAEIDAGEVVPALERHARSILGPDVVVRTSNAVQDLPDPTTAKVLYLAGREAIANVLKHAQASVVGIGLDDGDGGYTLTVADDGIGVSAASTRGVGLALMRERVAAVGGSVELVSSDGGTTLTVRVPEGSP